MLYSWWKRNLDNDVKHIIKALDIIFQAEPAELIHKVVIFSPFQRAYYKITFAICGSGILKVDADIRTTVITHQRFSNITAKLSVEF